MFAELLLNALTLETAEPNRSCSGTAVVNETSSFSLRGKERKETRTTTITIDNDNYKLHVNMVLTHVSS
jgi:hypothetical protein